MTAQDNAGVTVDIMLEQAREAGFVSGQRRALTDLYRLIAGGLADAKLPARDAARLQVERGELVLLLRKVCAEFGDNDWDDTLFLPDVVSKHLLVHLREGKR